MAESPDGATSSPTAGTPHFALPTEVLEALPSDPFEQLDVARKITSMALASRISALESEASSLRLSLSERDDVVEDLRAKVHALDGSLADLSDRLARAQDEKESLINENAILSNTVKKLNRDVSRLEIFKKTLVQSLNDEEGPQGVAWVAPKLSETASFSSGSLAEDSDAGSYPIKSYYSSQLSESGSTVTELGASSSEIDGLREGRLFGPLASQGSTPRVTPPGSPPRRHSISVSSIRNNTYDGRSSIFAPLTSSHHSPMRSPFEMGTQAARTRVDGKEFFRQVRTRLTHEQFNAFLTNVKDLNAHKQTREETLRKADDIFGENKDLYAIFEGLITRNLH